MRIFAFLALTAALASAQPTNCTTRCNTEASECMKTCIGDPKDAQNPERAKHLMTCMKSCEDTNKQCKATCAERPKEAR
ncbi:MAG: hypothetical protein ACOZQL_08295 [Myxococcota bacterium]